MGRTEDNRAFLDYFHHSILDRHQHLEVEMTRKATIDDVKKGLKGKRVVVVGMAKTGLAAAEFLVQQGAAVTVSEIKTEEALGNSPQRLRSLGAEVEVGVHSPETFFSADLIVLSPGVDPAIPPLEQARAKGIPLASEIELASWCSCHWSP